MNSHEGFEENNLSYHKKSILQDKYRNLNHGTHTKNYITLIACKM